MLWAAVLTGTNRGRHRHTEPWFSSTGICWALKARTGLPDGTPSAAAQADEGGKKNTRPGPVRSVYRQTGLNWMEVWRTKLRKSDGWEDWLGKWQRGRGWWRECGWRDGEQWVDAELAKVEKRDAEREEEENTNIKKGTNEGKQKMKEGGRKRTGSQLVLSSLSSFPYILPFSHLLLFCFPPISHPSVPLPLCPGALEVDSNECRDRLQRVISACLQGTARHVPFITAEGWIQREGDEGMREAYCFPSVLTPHPVLFLQLSIPFPCVFLSLFSPFTFLLL